MLQALAHRGPDDQGVCAFRCAGTGHHVFLGHRRLAIIDPRRRAPADVRRRRRARADLQRRDLQLPRAARTSWRRAGYRFARDSDTEVLLRAYQHWGAGRRPPPARHVRVRDLGCAQRASVSRARPLRRKAAVPARGRAASCYFASEIKALLRVPGIAAERRPASRLGLSRVPLRAGPAHAVRRHPQADARDRAPPGSAARSASGATGRAPDRSPRASARAAASRRRRRASCSGSTRRCKLQMVSDVPFGAFLSGGLDSSTIVALMSRHNSQGQDLLGRLRRGRLQRARLRGARWRGTSAPTHHELVVDRPRPDGAGCRSWSAFRDAPVSEPSDIPIYMLACEAARSVKMVLTGEGSDEMLGRLSQARRRALRAGLSAASRRACATACIEPLAHALPYGFRRIKTAVTNLNIEDWRERYVRWFGALSRAERDQLAVLRLNGTPVADAPPFDADPRSSALRRILYFDQTSWLPDNLLERGDRMTHGGLDRGARAVPRSRAGGVRLLAARRLPRDAACDASGSCARRAGTSSRARSWSGRKWAFACRSTSGSAARCATTCCDHLQGAASLTRALLRRCGVLDRILAEHLNGRQNHEKLLWTLLNLEIWHRQYA